MNLIIDCFSLTRFISDSSEVKTIKTAYGQPLETSPTLQGTCSENVIVTSKGPVFVSESVMAGCVTHPVQQLPHPQALCHLDSQWCSMSHFVHANKIFL